VRLLVELSGEHPELPAAEVHGALAGEGATATVVAQEPGVLAVDTDADAGALASRIALARYVDTVLSVGTLKDALLAAREVDLRGETFSIRAVTPAFSKGSSEKTSLEGEVGAVLGARGTVDLENPARRFRLILGERVYLAEVLHGIDRVAYERRRPEERLHPLPISLHPRLARALVNLSRVSRGGRLHDPFCGTGGILIEAALMGSVTSGSDIQEAMVSRTEEELQRLGASARVFTADVGDFPDATGEVDAIATDPPYGRSSSTGGESVGTLYRRTYEACARALRPGGWMAIVLPDRRYVELAGDAWKLTEVHALRVHGSLTRHFCVFRAY
jgi:tRNA (guanine10-N2)-dimethyltransferase